jgi:serine/threonine protein kinase
MNPEQARSQLVDKRTDIWSFGCVLYEMLTGRRTFEGQTTSDLIAAILEPEPDQTGLPAATTPVIRRLLERCSEKTFADVCVISPTCAREFDDALLSSVAVAALAPTCACVIAYRRVATLPWQRAGPRSTHT